MAYGLVQYPLGEATRWDVNKGFISPFDQQPLNAPRDAQGNIIPGVWDPQVGAFRLDRGGYLGQPRVAGSPVNNPFLPPLPGVTSQTGAGGAATKNPFSTISNPKSQPINSVNASLIDRIKKLSGGSGTQDFQTQFKAEQPRLAQEFQTESKVIPSFFSGEVDAERNRLNDEAFRAGQASLDNTIARTLSGVQGRKLLGNESGPSSYLARLGVGATAPLSLRLAQQYADAKRAIYEQGLVDRRSLLGQNANLADAYLNRLLRPGQVENADILANLGNLGPASAIDLAQNFYGLSGDPNAIGHSYTVPNYGVGPYPGVSGNLPRYPVYNPYAAGNQAVPYFGATPTGAGATPKINPVMKFVQPRVNVPYQAPGPGPNDIYGPIVPNISNYNDYPDQFQYDYPGYLTDYYS